jgi:hypothetical protein
VLDLFQGRQPRVLCSRSEDENRWQTELARALGAIQDELLVDAKRFEDVL